MRRCGGASPVVAEILLAWPQTNVLPDWCAEPLCAPLRFLSGACCLLSQSVQKELVNLGRQQHHIAGDSFDRLSPQIENDVALLGEVSADTPG